MGKRKYSGKEETPKKSKLEENEEDNIKLQTTPVNETNTNNSTSKNGGFDIKHFRKELASKQSQSVALTQFLQACLCPERGTALIQQYLQSGGNAHEILRQLPADSRKNLPLAAPVAHLFHLIILQVQSSLPHLIAVTEEACRYFLNNFSSTIELMISESSGPRHKKIILKLLTSMVTLNPELGVEVLNQAPLTPKHLHHILEKPNYKEKDNVRTAFVHFMTSFLVEGHLPLIKALLEKQGLLALVIPGLGQDEAEAVLMFINILKKNVVDNQLISKSLKLKTFSHNVIHQMFKIYFWRGPPDTSHDVINECRPAITKLLSEILLTLFTCHKLGLYFVDSTLGTTDANKNQNLYKALLTLRRPWENKAQCEVILEIVYRCPDLHRALITLIEQNFEPQHTPIWERSVDFFITLMDKMKPEELINRFSNLNSLQVANFIRFTTLPVPLLKFIQINLVKSDRSISLYCIKVLLKMLKTLRRYLQILEMNNLQYHVGELRNKLDFFFPKHLPAPISIVALIDQIVQDDLKKNSEAKDYTLPEIDRADALISLIDLLLLYSDIHPAHFEALEGSLNMKDILDFSNTLSERSVAILKFKIVSLWLTLDNSAVSLKNPLFKELFQIMLEVYTSEDTETWMEAKETILNFFKTTLIFEADEDEIHIMLYTLRNCAVIPTTIGDIVEHVLEKKNELTEYVHSQMAPFEMINESSEENLEKLLDNLMKGTNSEDICFLENKIASPFIIGCIEYSKNKKEVRKTLKQFLSVYVANLLHCNYTPELTQVFIGDAKIEVRDYVSSWIDVPTALNEKIAGKDKTLLNVSDIIINSKDVEIDKMFPLVETGTLEDSDITFLNTPYKMNTIEIDGSQLIIWANYLIFCTVRLSNMDQLKEESQNKINNIFQFLMNLAKKQLHVDMCRTIVLNLLKNPHVLKMYNPVNSNQDESGFLATNFLLNVINDNRDIVDYLNDKHNVLKPFEKKNYNEITKALTKIKKKKNANTENTVKILETIGMSSEDDIKTLNQLFDVDISHCIKNDREPSLVLEVTRVLVSKYAKIGKTDLPLNILQKVFKLYTTLLVHKTVTPNLTNVEQTLTEYFDNKPYHVRHIRQEDFKNFFYANAVRKTTSQLAAILLRLNHKLCATFKEELNRPEILSQRELTLPLGNALLNHNKFLLENKALMITIFNEYKSNIFKFLEKPHKAGQIYITCWKFIRKLLNECVGLDECEKLFSKIHKFEIVELSHVKLFETAFLRMYLEPQKLKKNYLINYFLSMLNLTTMAIKECKNADDLHEIVTIIYTILQINNSFDGAANNANDFKKMTESSIWQSFCKTVLKDSLKVKTEVDDSNASGPKLLFLLTTLVKICYPEDNEDIISLFDMVTSHSEFLKVMLSINSPEIKTRLIEFIHTLILKNKSVMKPQQIPVYLSAYHATTHPSDRRLLTILHFYESNDLNVQEYKPYLFGDSAANYYAVRKRKSSSLWAHPTPNQILNLFDKESIELTMRHFPVTQKLEYNYDLHSNIDNEIQSGSIQNVLKELSSDNFGSVTENEAAILKIVMRSKYSNVIKTISEKDLSVMSHSETKRHIYDPAFVFPLLSHMLAPGSAASGFRLLRRGMVGLAVAGLGSMCPNMRAAAYHVLHRYCLLLETETRHKNDKLLLTEFIDLLRRSLSSAMANNTTEFDLTSGFKNPRLPAINALYLAKALMISTAPFDPIYKPVNNFLIAKDQVDLTVVPDFLTLFHDSDVEAADRRTWILEIIRDGTRTMTDVNVVFKTMCLKMMMDFYSSVLSDRKCQDRILGVIGALVAIPRAFDILVEGYGLLSWLHNVSRQIGKEDKSLFRRMLTIIENIISSMFINSLAKNLKKNQKPLIDLPECSTNKDVEHDLLVMLYNMGSLIQWLDFKDLVLYIRTYNSLSKRTVKLLSKNQMLSLLEKYIIVSKSEESIKLLSKAISTSNVDILKSKSLRETNNAIDDISNLACELQMLVKSYVSNC